MKTKFNFFLMILFGYANLLCQNLVFTTDYIALTTPIQYDGELYYTTPDKKMSIKHINEVVHDKSILNSFSNLVSNVTVYEMKADGDLTFVGVGISGKNSTYQVIYDFSQTQTLLSSDPTNNYNSLLVGVGVRMVAKIKTRKAGINLSSPIGLAANIENIEGSLEVRVSGIGSQKINGLIPTTSDLSPSSISNGLQAISTIKSHIYDDETIISPQILAYSKNDKNITEKSTKQKIK
ncbi:hypothetical protein [Epilithonimonas hispanica]|uniref:Uncharacterized protein n=1 Tax=Epilithonimonas hispanica TaxID=358687 RepID=A0A3D9CKD8_9FLAO|nr:hypothetical protein [Epilithonimonas hispanica]REC66198.1 hypothetical protein DRF58_17060 [Epilithonimonas hispanica]